MKFLVIDNEKHVAARLGHDLQDLGQEVVICPDPAQAIDALRHLVVDAVITDVQMPGMNAIEFAEILWLLDRFVPIAFRASVADPVLLDEASAIGTLFPAGWVMSDLERVIAQIARKTAQAPLWPVSLTSMRSMRSVRSTSSVQQQVPADADGIPAAIGVDVASGSSATDVSGLQPTPPETSTVDGSRTRLSSVSDAWLLVPMRNVARKIHVTCRTWNQVERLCARADVGRDVLSLRGSHQLAPGDRIIVVLELPQSLMASLTATVQSVQTPPQPATGSDSNLKPPATGEEAAALGRTVIRLTGLTPPWRTRLRQMAKHAQHNASPVGTNQYEVLPPATNRPNLSNDLSDDHCPMGPSSRSQAGTPQHRRARRQSARTWPMKQQIDRLIDRPSTPSDHLPTNPFEPS